MNENAARLAEKAAELISEHGLAKGIEQDDKGRLCWYGAVKLAAGGIPNEYNPKSQPAGWPGMVAPVVDMSVHILGKAGFCGGVVDYNDDPGTTGEDIILLFKRTAEKLRT